MTKELEYIQRHIDIVKQQVKGSKMKIIVTDVVTKHQYDYYERELQTLESIEKSLQRLESIDNSNPSEALKCFENMQCRIASNISTIEYATIKQALLKAQEPKQYLKWGDLEFTNKVKEMKVKLGDNPYEIEYYICNCNALGLRQPVVILKTSDFIAITIEQFFNDLHLERVEE